MRIDLIKYQALGNDYLVLDMPGPLDQLVPLLPALCDRHLGLGSEVGLDGIVQFLLTDGTFLGERRIAGNVQLGLAELRLRSLKICLRLFQVGASLIKRCAKRPRIYFEESRVFANECAIRIALFYEKSLYLGANLGIDKPI